MGFLYYADHFSKTGSEQSINLYKRYLSYFPYMHNGDRILFNIATNIIPMENGNACSTIFSDGSSIGSIYINQEMLDNATVLYKKIYKTYPNSKYGIKAYNNLLCLYTYTGNTKAGEETIKTGLRSKIKKIYLIAVKYDMLYETAKRNYPAVIKTANTLIKLNEADSEIYKLLGDAYLFNSDYKNARSSYAKTHGANNSYSYDFDINKYNIYINSLTPAKETCLQTYTLAKGKGSTISGSVKIKGVGIPFATVILAPYQNGGMSSADGDVTALSGLTDYKGDYVLKNIPPGDFKIGLIIPSPYLNNAVKVQNPIQVLDTAKNKNFNCDFNFSEPIKMKSNTGFVKPLNDKILLQWNKQPNAAYYQLDVILFGDSKSFTGSYSTLAITKNLYSTKFLLDINNYTIDSYGSFTDSNGYMNPHSYLGLFYNNCKTPVFVNAYDKNGLLISSTAPQMVNYKNLVIINNAQKIINPGDAYVLSHRLGKAITYYENYLKAHPRDIHSMTVLSNIYTAGTHFVTKTGTSTGKNLNRALELNEQLYNITQNVSYLSRKIFIYGYELSKPQKIIEEYNRYPKATLEASDYETLGETYLSLGRLTEAQKSFKSASKLKGNSINNDLPPLLLDLYNGDLIAALIYTNNLAERIYSIDKESFLTDITKLKKSDLITKDYTYFQQALKITFKRHLEDHDKDNFKLFIKITKNPYLKDILIQIGRSNLIINELLGN